MTKLRGCRHSAYTIDPPSCTWCQGHNSWRQLLIAAASAAALLSAAPVNVGARCSRRPLVPARNRAQGTDRSADAAPQPSATDRPRASTSHTHRARRRGGLDGSIRGRSENRLPLRGLVSCSTSLESISRLNWLPLTRWIAPEARGKTPLQMRIAALASGYAIDHDVRPSGAARRSNAYRDSRPSDELAQHVRC